MAMLDPQERCLVLRLIYDGPAFAGKTTNLRVLADRLGSELFSGEEAEGRTLYLDWVNYVGGLFEGMPIRCQIVSVPGQRVLESRRRQLLETADVVVFVADSRQEQLAENIRSFEILQSVMSPKSPPVGIVVQANKRDAESAISLDALRDALSSEAPLAMTEAVAERGDGVRESFVLAVRLALDRVRECWDDDSLPRVRPNIETGVEMIAEIQAIEGGSIPERTRSETTARVGGGRRDRDLFGRLPSSRPNPNPSSGPPFPGDSIPPGFVWPPVQGRLFIHEANREDILLERGRSGDWIGTSSSWMLRSPLEGLFFDLEAGRTALLNWARWHVKSSLLLSAPRSLLLNPEGGNVWRLWQLVQRVPTLQSTIMGLFSQQDDEVLGEGLARAIDCRLRAEERFVGSGWLHRLDLESVGFSVAGEPWFTGFAPYLGVATAVPRSVETDQDQLLRRELAPLLRDRLELEPRRIPSVLASLRHQAVADGRESVAESIQRILLAT